MNEMTPADYAAINRGGMGFGGDGGWWLILLFLFAMNGGWGNGWGNAGGGGETAYMQRGFDQNAVMNGINGINNAVNTGFANTATQLCGGFAGVNAGIANGFAQAEIAANGRQMADMNQMFGVQSALQNCCCENRAATADLKYTVATEACAGRAAVTGALQQLEAQNAANTNALLNAINGGIQSLKDQNCQYQLDQKDDIIGQLRQQVNMMNLAASQGAQTATIQAGQRALASEVEQYVAPKAVPAYLVQNPNCCGQAYGCPAA